MQTIFFRPLSKQEIVAWIVTLYAREFQVSVENILPNSFFFFEFKPEIERIVTRENHFKL